MSDDAPNRRAPTRAVRLIFEYEGDRVTLVDQVPVTKALEDPAVPRAQPAGLYVDSRDRAGRSLARVVVPDAMKQSAEVFPERPGEPFKRVDVPARGAFTVVVPMSQEADHVAVMRQSGRGGDVAVTTSAPPTDAERQAGSVELGRFPLTVNR